MRKLTELELMKYWIDAEFTILHAMFAILLHQLVDTTWVKWGLVAYIVYSIFYAFVRIAIVANQDKSFLRVPRG